MRQIDALFKSNNIQVQSGQKHAGYNGKDQDENRGDVCIEHAIEEPKQTDFIDCYNGLAHLDVLELEAEQIELVISRLHFGDFGLRREKKTPSQ